ncbi:zinc finger protein 600-like [Ylistrum balloti]|uniref:zinc finger protein 600-like n=1 Tax=Ylistrum balloti TaxID=509963 RepID=UPI0029059B55|nr:zinc finger protein 600-like [Ylistrum balloti]
MFMKTCTPETFLIKESINQMYNTSHQLDLSFQENSPKSKKRHFCPECDFVTDRHYSLKRHMIMHNQQYFVCSLCGARFNENCKLRKHVQITHKDLPPIQTTTTPQHFNSGAEPFNDPNLNLILDKNHLKGKRLWRTEARFKCDQCNYTTEHKYRIKRHQRIHKGDYFKCDLCNNKFTELCELRAHRQSRHEGITVKCELCGREFASKYALSHHRSSMHPNKFYRCNHCDKSFVTMGQFYDYCRQVVDGQDKKTDPVFPRMPYTGTPNVFQCDRCTYTTNVKYRMTRHQRIHSGDYLKCDLCSAKFTEPCELRAHRLSRHEGISVACPVCGKLFPSKHSLSNHRAQQHPKKTFTCTFCKDRSFVKLGNLQHHIDTFHKS